jgi:phosphomevalonate kinase
LEGAPAIVVAVDRCAIADGTSVDVSALYSGETKLGLGSSAAQLVARLGHEAASHGEDLGEKAVRDRLFAAARAEHAKEQSGGSGFDIAAAVYGGVLRYQLDDASPRVDPITLPEDVCIVALWTGRPARTSELRAKVDAFKARDPAAWRNWCDQMSDACVDALEAIPARDASRFVQCASRTGVHLGALGDLSGADLFPKKWRALLTDAYDEGGACYPSGAGGGDCVVWIGFAPPSDGWLADARKIGFQPLALATDRLGVRVVV